MVTLKVKVTFTEEVLGTASANPEVHREFIASNAPDAPSMEEEVAALGVEKREIVVGYEVGDNVKITDGALESFLGVVDEIDLDRGKVSVVVSMFGRETPVELDLDQIEPVS